MNDEVGRRGSHLEIPKPVTLYFWLSILSLAVGLIGGMLVLISQGFSFAVWASLVIVAAIVGAATIGLALGVRWGSRIAWGVSLAFALVGVGLQVRRWTERTVAEAVFSIVIAGAYLFLLLHPQTIAWVRRSQERRGSFFARNRGLILVAILALGISFVTVVCAFIGSMSDTPQVEPQPLRQAR